MKYEEWADKSTGVKWAGYRVSMMDVNILLKGEEYKKIRNYIYDQKRAYTKIIKSDGNNAKE